MIGATITRNQKIQSKFVKIHQTDSIFTFQNFPKASALKNNLPLSAKYYFYT